VADMLHDLFAPGILDRGERQSISLHLHRRARRCGVEIQKSKADTFRAVMRHTHGDEIGNLDYLINYIVVPAWQRIKAAAAQPQFVDVTDRLLAVYTQFEGIGYSARRVSRRLNRLAKVAGLPDLNATPYLQRHLVYKQAVERGFGASPEAGELLRVLALVETARRPRKPEPAQPEATQPKATKEVYTVSVHASAIGSCGFVYGEDVEATATDDLRAGDIGCVHARGAETWDIGRVLSIDAETITLRMNESEQTYRRAELDFEGRVDPKPVGRWDGPTPEESARLERLRQRLEGVDADDITNSTSLLKIEREIFDIEHPVDVNDWSAWEESDE
jgi:hypothetical protein